MTNIVLVLTTVPADAGADSGDRIASALVEERLAACVNIGAPMTSVYSWQGNLTRDAERQLVIKTTADRIAAVKARLTELHSYELPEILVIPVVEGSDSYLDWVRIRTAAETSRG
jgi:periplasmic divalent cation tolerance protein